MIASLTSAIIETCWARRLISDVSLRRCIGCTLPNTGGGRPRKQGAGMAEQETLVANSIPSAIFELGVLTRVFDVSLLSGVLPVLLTDDHIQQSVLLAIQQTAYGLVQCYNEVETDRAREDRSYNDNLTADIHCIHLPALRTLADQAITPAHPYRMLYEFGAAIGDYVLQCKNRQTPPDPSMVWRSLCALPARVLDNILILKELAATTATAAKVSTLETVIEGILPVKISPEATDDRPVIVSSQCGEVSLILRFVDAVSLELKRIPWPAESKWRSVYLELQLDDEQRRVKRHGYDEIVALSKLNFGLLTKLAAERSKATPLEELSKEWHKWGQARTPSEGTIRDAVNELGNKLRVLGIDTKGARDEGWVLVATPS